MDRTLIERMVGAVVLVLLLVLFAPALLDGQRAGDGVAGPGAATDGEMRTEVIVLNEPRNSSPPMNEPDSTLADPLQLSVERNSNESVLAAAKAPPADSPVAAAQKAPPATSPAPISPEVKPLPPPASPAVAKPVAMSAKSAKPASSPETAKQVEQKAPPAPAKQAEQPVPAVAPSAVPQAARPAAISPKMPEGFAVQLGSFASQDNAENFAIAVRKDGFAVFILRASAPSGQVYRVHAGPRKTRAAAEKLASSLAASGRGVLVVDLSAKK